ncbi:MAG: PaaI family thioesterase [Syntrophales bacterium]
MPDYSTYLRRVQAGEKNLNPYLDYFEITLEEVREGHARFRMPVLREYMQGAGFLQGGLIVALADEAIAHAAMTVLEPASGLTTVELKCNFLAPVKKGELIAEASIFKKGRTLIIGDCLVKDENGKDVLRCTATFLMFPDKKGSE